MKAAIVAALLLSSTAFAARAILVNSETGYSVTGQIGWICTYEVYGNQFTRFYRSSCPSSVEVE